MNQSPQSTRPSRPTPWLRIIATVVLLCLAVQPPSWADDPVQPQAMDVRYLAKEYGGRLCFNGGVDVQGTLIRGTPDDVRAEVYRLVDLFGRFDGGYIGGKSHSIMPETPLDNIIAMYEEFCDCVASGRQHDDRSRDSEVK